MERITPRQRLQSLRSELEKEKEINRILTTALELNCTSDFILENENFIISDDAWIKGSNNAMTEQKKENYVDNLAKDCKIISPGIGQKRIIKLGTANNNLRREVGHENGIRLLKDKNSKATTDLTGIKKLINGSGVYQENINVGDKKNVIFLNSIKLLELSQFPSVAISMEGDVVYVNKAYVKLSGISRWKLIDSSYTNCFVATDSISHLFSTENKSQKTKTYSIAVRQKVGSSIETNWKASTYKDHLGVVLAIILTMVEKRKGKSVVYSSSYLEGSRDPLFIVNRKGIITYLNQASLSITNGEREKMIGTAFTGYFTEKNEAILAYKKVFANGFVDNYPLTIMDGKLTPTLFSGSIYKDAKGNELGAMMVARVITEQKRFEKELTEARIFAELATEIAVISKAKAESAARIAEDALKAKQQFLSNMSHEIRTPMNAIIGFTKVVLKTSLSEKQTEYLSAIKTSGDALIVLINDILDLAKVDAGKMTFEQVPFKLSASIESMLHLFETKIQEKNIKLSMLYDEKIPQILMGDAARLHQIILNLVSNAVKFTNEGNIGITVRMLSDVGDKVKIEFSLSDTGIGIPEDRIESIFDYFQQATSETSRIYGGTGLGLAIVKQLVESQGGFITVESKMGQGSTFTFVLSFNKAIEEAVSEANTVDFVSDTNSIKVLVVEDIPLNQLLMKTILDDYGFKWDVAENGLIAIEKLKLKKYDLILMDLQMPIMDGFEATSYIRNTMKSNIPIIALTADVTTVDLSKCKSVGINDYLAKPVDDSILYGKIVNLVKKSIIAGELQEEHILNNNIEVFKCTDLSYLRKRTKSNTGLIIEMLDLYLLQTPVLVKSMKDGLIGENWVALGAAIHKLIPSFSIVGLNSDFEIMAKKVHDYSLNQINREHIHDMVLKLETICTQACEELTEEVAFLKKSHTL